MRARAWLRFSVLAVAIGAVTLGLRPSSSLAPGDLAASSESLAMHGTPGFSVEHASVDLSKLVLEARTTPVEQSEERKNPRHPPKPPLPSGASLRLETRRPHSEAIEAPRVASPPLASSFQAIPDDGRFFPPDSEGAVGLNHVMTTLNSQVRVQDRSGREILTMDLVTFWSSVRGGLDVSDPKILYDPSVDRWIAGAVAGLDTANSSIFIGVSKSSDPTGTWNLYRVGVDPGGKLWADFPTLGFNKNWIAIQVNVWTVVPANANPTFQETHIYVFDKANLLAGGADARYTLFTRTDLGTGQAPAATYDPSEEVLYVLEDWDGNSGGVGSLQLFSVSGPVGSEVFRSISFPATDQTWDDVPPGSDDNFAPQKGSSNKISTAGSDFTQVIFRNGLITATHTIFLPSGGAPTRSAAQWWQLTTDGFIVQRGRLEDPSGQMFYAYPSAAANRNNDLLLGFSTFSLQQYPSAGYAFRAAGDPGGTLRDVGLLKSGESPYVRIADDGRNRWGDYSASVLDPANALDFWTIQEYAGQAASAALSRWATWWGRVIPDSGTPVPLPVASFSSPASSVAGQPVAFADSSSGATQWFWNFGDGSTVAERNPTHVFALSGTLTVTETVVNQTGAATASRKIEIAPPPKAAPLPPAARPRNPRRIAPRS